MIWPDEGPPALVGLLRQLPSSWQQKDRDWFLRVFTEALDFSVVVESPVEDGIVTLNGGLLAEPVKPEPAVIHGTVPPPLAVQLELPDALVAEMPSEVETELDRAVDWLTHPLSDESLRALGDTHVTWEAVKAAKAEARGQALGGRKPGAKWKNGPVPCRWCERVCATPGHTRTHERRSHPIEWEATEKISSADAVRRAVLWDQATPDEIHEVHVTFEEGQKRTTGPDPENVDDTDMLEEEFDAAMDQAAAVRLPDAKPLLKVKPEKAKWVPSGVPMKPVDSEHSKRRAWEAAWGVYDSD